MYSASLAVAFAYKISSNSNMCDKKNAGMVFKVL